MSGETLLPGDMVEFAGHQWEVFVTPKHQQPESAIAIWRPEHPGRACDVIDLLRQRQELALIPRTAREATDG